MDAGKLIRALLSGARPKTLAAGVVPVWVGGVLAWKLKPEVFNWWLLACTLLGALCIQIATNFFNDAVDGKKGADGERRTGPRRLTGTGDMTFGNVMTLGALFLFGAVFFGAFLVMERGWPMLAIGIPSLFLAYGYTGEYPLAYRGLGELFVILFFGFVAVMGTVFVQTGTWPPEAILLGGQVGLLSAVLISVNNFRDREEDALVGKRTLAVRCGGKVAAAVIWLEIKLAAFLGIAWMAWDHPIFLTASVPVFAIGMRIVWGVLTLPADARMNRLLALGALELVLFAAAFHAVAWLV